MDIKVLHKNPVVLLTVGAAIAGAAVYIYKKRQRKNWIVVPAVEEDEADMTLFTDDAQPRPKFVLTEEAYKWTNQDLAGLVPDTASLDELFDAAVAEEVPVASIFTADDQWVWADELAARGDAVTLPHILHYEEFINDAMGFRQETVTWYERDDVVADGLDEPILRYKQLMGPLKFGHGSNDANVVYIRNPRLKIEWEVLRHTGSFAQEVLGESMVNDGEAELQHNYASRRFRAGD